jgi:hypothetical protein
VTDSLEARILRLENQNRRLRWGVILALLVIPLAAFTLPTVGNGSPGSGSGTIDSLRVRELVVVDEAGTVRARLGGELPDAVIEGRRVVRGDVAAGLLLFDKTGVERGGYVTFAESGNIALTLDSRTRQVALFVAGPEEGSALKLWHRDDWIELRSGSEGSRLSMGEGGVVLGHNPPLGEAQVAMLCEAIRSEVIAAGVADSEAVIQQACATRMPSEACRANCGPPPGSE